MLHQIAIVVTVDLERQSVADAIDQLNEQIASWWFREGEYQLLVVDQPFIDDKYSDLPEVK